MTGAYCVGRVSNAVLGWLAWLNARMRARRNAQFTTAAFDLGFAIAAFGCGLFNAPMWATGLVAFSMLAYWSWSRRTILNRLRGAAWASQTGLAIAVIIAILAGSFWLGLGMGGSI